MREQLQKAGELARLWGKVTDIVELKRFGGVLDEVKHVVHPGDQAVNVLPIQWRYERPVEKRERLVSHLVGAVFELENAGDALTALVFLARGDVPTSVAAPVALGVTVGALAGSKLLPHANVRELRMVFVVIMILIAIEMGWRALNGI